MLLVVINDLKQQIESFHTKVAVKTREAELLQRELEGVRELWLIAIGPDEPCEIMEPDLTRVQGEQRAVATIAKNTDPIGRSNMQAELGEDLADIRAEIAEDQLKRIDIRAHELTVRTVGGVTQPPETS